MQALVCVVFVLALRLPFLNQAIQGDDVYYLAGAEYAQTDPLHPHHARYAFMGDMVDMRGHPHPPLDTWALAGLLAVTGDIREPLYHGAYILFSLIAALAALSLARRFSPRPLAATLLFLVVPAFVVNGTSLEADLPFLAFWMAAIALFVRAVDTRSRPALAASAVAMALAALAAYQSVALTPVLGIYLWIRRPKWRAATLALLTPLAVLAAWQMGERLATGALPATVLRGYFESYGWQRWAFKIRNAAALTVHLGWLVFPALAVAAFFRVSKWAIAAIAVAALALIYVDPNPLFWASWAVGALVVAALVEIAVRGTDPDERFLSLWTLVFFAVALVVLFAGSARYLLPMAAPVVLLVARRLGRPWLAGGVAAGLALGLMLAAVNYQHWDGYRQFVAEVRPEIARTRTWIDGEWGLRFYGETAGALPLLRTTQPRVGDIVLTSELGSFTAPSGAPRRLLVEREVRSALPFRLIGLGARSGYSTASAGLRPFDLSTAPIDRVRAEVIAEREPTVSYLPMGHPEAEYDIVTGIGKLESGTWRWTTDTRAVVELKSPDRPLALEADLYIPDNAPARRVQLLAAGAVVAEETFAAPGQYTLRSSPFRPATRYVTVALQVDSTFLEPGGERRLGVVLQGIGFR